MRTAGWRRQERAPGVLIAHEPNGLDDYQRTRPEMLAELGYAALAMDYHGGGRVYTDREQMMARLEEIGSDPDRLRPLGLAGLDARLAQPRVDPSRVAAKRAAARAWRAMLDLFDEVL